MANQGATGTGTDPQIRVKVVVLGKAPQLTDVPNGMTVGAFLQQQGLEGREATIGTQVVGPDHVLKDGDAVVLKERLQAGM